MWCSYMQLSGLVLGYGRSRQANFITACFCQDSNGQMVDAIGSTPIEQRQILVAPYRIVTWLRRYRRRQVIMLCAPIR
jgi:hypothetical protein